MRHTLLVVASSLAAVMPAAADTHSNLARGFAADKAFQIGDVDHVNLFNGNLIVALPIGGSYPVGGGLSYGFTLSFNSNPWNFVERLDKNGMSLTQAIPNARANGGFGWMFTLGRLESPVWATNDSGHWLYVGPDGSEHPFFDTLHVGGSENPTAGFFYTRDSSYMRLHTISPEISEVEMPGGQIHQFGSDGEIKEIRDRFGNKVTLTQLPGGLTWQITDSAVVGRMQTVTFSSDPILGKRLNQVVLTAFGGLSSTYTFHYAP